MNSKSKEALSIESELGLLTGEREAVYLFALPEGRLLYVSVDKCSRTYASLRLFVGSPDGMEEIPIREAKRYNDGGTTYIWTNQGNFYSPASERRGAKAKWGRVVLARLNPDWYEILESGQGVRISILPE